MKNRLATALAALGLSFAAGYVAADARPRTPPRPPEVREVVVMNGSGMIRDVLPPKVVNANDDGTLSVYVLVP